MAVFLVCEGENHGLDNRVLDPLVIQHHNLSVQMAPLVEAGAWAGSGSTYEILHITTSRFLSRTEITTEL